MGTAPLRYGLSVLMAFMIAGALFLTPTASAQSEDCTCSYELDSMNGKSYFVLKKELETSCKVLVLSHSDQTSPYLNKLKTEKGYEVVGEYFTFEGARFMAIGECEDCQKESENN